MIKYLELEISALAGAASNKNKVFVILKEKDGERVLPVTMNKIQAMAIMSLKKLSIPFISPVSIPDILFDMLERCEVNLCKVVLTSVKEGLFFCDVVARHGNEEHTISLCRATDGIEIAVRAKCPIYITEELLQAQYMQKISTNSYAMNISSVTGSMLEDALQHALQSEDYEAASKIRDELSKRSHNKMSE